MKRIAAAWRARNREHGHRAPVGVIAALVVMTMVGAAPSGSWVAGGILSLGWVAVWVWGMWDEGGHLVDRKYGRRLRRR